MNHVLSGVFGRREMAIENSWQNVILAVKKQNVPRESILRFGIILHILQSSIFCSTTTSCVRKTHSTTTCCVASEPNLWITIVQKGIVRLIEEESSFLKEKSIGIPFLSPVLSQ